MDVSFRTRMLGDGEEWGGVEYKPRSVSPTPDTTPRLLNDLVHHVLSGISIKKTLSTEPVPLVKVVWSREMPHKTIMRASRAWLNARKRCNRLVSVRVLPTGCANWGAKLCGMALARWSNKLYQSPASTAVRIPAPSSDACWLRRIVFAQSESTDGTVLVISSTSGPSRRVGLPSLATMASPCRCKHRWCGLRCSSGLDRASVRWQRWKQRCFSG